MFIIKEKILIISQLQKNLINEKDDENNDINNVIKIDINDINF